jgi:hypothetical protein
VWCSWTVVEWNKLRTRQGHRITIMGCHSAHVTALVKLQSSTSAEPTCTSTSTCNPRTETKSFAALYASCLSSETMISVYRPRLLSCHPRGGDYTCGLWRQNSSICSWCHGKLPMDTQMRILCITVYAPAISIVHTYLHQIPIPWPNIPHRTWLCGVCISKPVSG